MAKVSSKVSFDFYLNEEEVNLLATILGAKNEAALRNTLAQIARAAFEEYIRMFIGQRVFTRGKDMLEYRLFLLTKEYFDNRIPGEQEVSDLFQTTSAESKGLIKSVMSKYQYELKTCIEDTLKGIIDGIKKPGSELIAVIINDSLKDELNKILATCGNGALIEIKKKQGTVANYIVEDQSYEELCNHFGIKRKVFP